MSSSDSSALLDRIQQTVLGLPRPVQTAAASAVAAALVLFVMDRFTRFRGTIKAMHLFERYGFTFKEIPDLSGKTFVVTGANSGLGFGTAFELASHGATVIMACRSRQRAEEAKRKMGAVKGELIVMDLDNASLVSVKKFARDFKALNRPLDGLILNAGIMFPPFELTTDGIESQFGVNHIAHFALANELLDVMAKPYSTIVSVSSLAHWFTVKNGVNLDLSVINDPKNYNPYAYYGQSKLANLLFTRELARRLGPNSHIYVNAVHPGGVQGELNRYMHGGNPILKAIDTAAQAISYWDCKEASLTVLCPAVSPRIRQENIRGQYFVPIGRLDQGSKVGRDQDLARRLWEFSERVLQEKGWDKM